MISLKGIFESHYEYRTNGTYTKPQDIKIQTLVGGKACGIIVGGNLSLICATIGTQYEIDTKGKILFWKK